MSRKRFRARAKTVQKLGRDGLVERNLATGEERRVSQRMADFSFGPERTQEQGPVMERPGTAAKGEKKRHRQHRSVQQDQPGTGIPPERSEPSQSDTPQAVAAVVPPMPGDGGTALPLDHPAEPPIQQIYCAGDTLQVSDTPPPLWADPLPEPPPRAVEADQPLRTREADEKVALAVEEDHPGTAAATGDGRPRFSKLTQDRSRLSFESEGGTPLPVSDADRFAKEKKVRQRRQAAKFRDNMEQQIQLPQEQDAPATSVMPLSQMQDVSAPETPVMPTANDSPRPSKLTAERSHLTFEQTGGAPTPILATDRSAKAKEVQQRRQAARFRETMEQLVQFPQEQEVSAPEIPVMPTANDSPHSSKLTADRSRLAFEQTGSAPAPILDADRSAREKKVQQRRQAAKFRETMEQLVLPPQEQEAPATSVMPLSQAQEASMPESPVAPTANDSLRPSKLTADRSRLTFEQTGSAPAPILDADRSAKAKKVQQRRQATRFRETMEPLAQPPQEQEAPAAPVMPLLQRQEASVPESPAAPTANDRPRPSKLTAERSRLTFEWTGSAPAPVSDADRSAKEKKVQQRRQAAKFQENMEQPVQPPQKPDAHDSAAPAHPTEDWGHPVLEPKGDVPRPEPLPQKADDRPHPSKLRADRTHLTFGPADSAPVLDLSDEKPRKAVKTQKPVGACLKTVAPEPLPRKADAAPLPSRLKEKRDHLCFEPPDTAPTPTLIFKKLDKADQGPQTEQTRPDAAVPVRHQEKSETGPQKDTKTGPASRKAAEEPPPKRTGPRLRFEDTPPPEDDAAPLSRKYDKAVRRVERAEQQVEKAREKLPVTRRLTIRREADSETGRPCRHLRFESEVQPEHIRPSLPARAAGAAATAAVMKLHSKVRESERQNVAVEAVHKGELLAEQGGGRLLRWQKNRRRSKPYRILRQAEQRAVKERVNLAWQTALRDNPELGKKPFLAKWMQKRRIKRQYAQAAHEVRQTAHLTQNVMETVKRTAQTVVRYAGAHKSVLLLIAALLLTVVLFSTGLTSCTAMLSSLQSSYLAASYVADEQDICNAELYYTEMETDLQININATEMVYPGYNEYRYSIGEISHNPYDLMGYLSTKFNAFTFHQVQPEIERLFGEQYRLTREVITEIRYDPNGNPYNWYVLRTTLTVRPLSAVIADSLTPGEEADRYTLYMQTLGNRQAYGNPFDFPWLSDVSSGYGYRVHPITGEKSLHRGVDIAVAQGTPIRAIHDGKVISAGDAGSYGLCVVIEDGKGYTSRYAHCASLSVSAGQEVQRGDVIAAVGSTGQSTGPHLHLEITHNGEYLNPYYFVDTGGAGNGALPGAPGGPAIPAYPGEPPTDAAFAAMLEEAEKHLGRAYVWGGSSPSTGFDCSGFVSWVINHSGWNVGRLGAKGLYNICTPVSAADVRPGDLVFFWHTYDAPDPNGVTHVGIYVGNGQMIHCGDPISYANINSSYWQDHFYSYARLP